ncbi:MAG: DUF1761 domain-containing protein [Myxococcaceae bacterium]|nr:DUF1761 domain-containing protein [Myxococcaceae bacterium]
MFNPTLSINWLAVLVASLALQALGAAWYMALFKKPYAKALGRSDLGAQKPAPLFIVGPMVCGAVVTVTNAVMMQALGIGTVGSALLFSAVVGAGYLVSTTVNVAINPNIPRPLFYGAVNGPFFFFSNILSCTIIVAMH